jgi:hypothetical protein
MRDPVERHGDGPWASVGVLGLIDVGTGQR